MMMNMMNQQNQPQNQGQNQQSGGEATSKDDIMKLLKELGELKAAGILTEEEFTEKKKELLANL